MSNLFIDSFILAVALSIDAMIVSFSQGLIFIENKRKNSFFLAFFVGFFQFLMPVVGWYFANIIYSYVNIFATWIAAVIFILLGVKFIKDAVLNKKDDTECNIATPFLSIKFVLLVSIATSIDALAAGMSINFLKMPLLFPAILIGVITFINSLIGFWCGYCFKQFNTQKLEIFAGLVLIFLGLKTIIFS